MEKKHLEIGISAGLVAMMIALMLIVQIAAPQGVRSDGFCNRNAAVHDSDGFGRSQATGHVERQI